MSNSAGLGRYLAYLRGRLGSLRPPHAFVLTRERLVYVSLPDGARAARETLAGAKTRSSQLSRGALRDLPCGVPVALSGLSDAVAALLGATKPPAAVSLAVPDEFVRVVAVDLEPGSEKNPREVEEVLGWKLGRAFGEDAPPLRISWQMAGPAPGGGTRVLGVGVPEEAAASWEGAFGSRGIRVGALESSTVAVSAVGRAALGGGDGFLVWADGGTVTTAFFAHGALRFMRTKPELDPDEAVHEIRLSASFVDDDGSEAGQGLDVTGAAVVAPESSPVVARFRAFRKESGGPEPVSLKEVLTRQGLPKGLEDPALIVGIGLLAGDE